MAIAVQPVRSSAVSARGVRAKAALVTVLALAFAGLAYLQVRDTLAEPVVWTPDALYYQARLLEFRGADQGDAIARTFGAPLSAELRARDPGHTGNPDWVRYNEPFYERRVAVPLAGAALYPVAGDRSLLYLSLAGYVASVLALFGLLLLRFKVAIAAGVTLAAVFLPPLVNHSSFPLTDSWGLALEILALAGALLVFDRGLRWLPVWIGAIALLAFTRDSTWIPVLAVGWCAFRYRSRAPLWLFATGVVAALPAVLLFRTPVRDLLALLVNDSEPSSDTSWWFIARQYPEALLELVRANVGFLRRGEWYTALYLVGGVVSLLLLAWRRPRRDLSLTLMTAAGFVALAYVLAAPSFSAFRLELTFVPVAAWGLALLTQGAAARLREGNGLVGRPLDRLPARGR